MPRKDRAFKLFTLIFKREPEDGAEIDRVICPYAGQPGHANCGICECGVPRQDCPTHWVGGVEKHG